MKIGITTNLVWYGTRPDEFAKAAEDLGFESLWMGEHIVLPKHVEREFLNGGQVPEAYRHMPSPFIWLTAAAVATKTLKLGTNVCLVPQRNPFGLAKDIACLDQISNGRFLFGAGAGWIDEEAAIMGYPHEERWPRTMEYLKVIKKLWTEEEPSFEGKFVSFPPLYSYPKPVQRPHPPIILGGGGPTRNNIPILRRVAEFGDGWAPGYFTPPEIAALLRTLRELCEANGRDYDALELSLIMPAAILGVGEAYASLGTRDRTAVNAQELIAQYEEAGIKRILMGMVDPTKEEGVKNLERAAKGLGLN
jgi:probable F420-dependent oxidoreductase